MLQRIASADSRFVTHFQEREQHFLLFTDARAADGEDVGAGSRSFDSADNSLLLFKRRASPDGCTFQLDQRIPFPGVRDVKVFSFGAAGLTGGRLFLSAVNASALVVMRREGAAGFQLQPSSSWVMRVTGGQAIQPLMLPATPAPSPAASLLLIVGQSRRCHGSLVFEAKMRGASLLPLSFRDSWSSYP